MSIRWSKKQEPPKTSTMVDFHEGALTAPVIDAHENQVNFRLEDMSRRVEDIQKRNSELEAKLAAQNEVIRDHTLQKLTTLEGRLAQNEDATKHETLRKLTNLETYIQHHQQHSTERHTPPNSIRDRTLDTIVRLEGRVVAPPAPLPTNVHPPPVPNQCPPELADEYLKERTRLHQLRSAQVKLGARN